MCKASTLEFILFVWSTHYQYNKKYWWTPTIRGCC